MLVTLVFVFTYKEVYSLIRCPKQSLSEIKGHSPRSFVLTHTASWTQQRNLSICSVVRTPCWHLFPLSVQHAISLALAMTAYIMIYHVTRLDIRMLFAECLLGICKRQELTSWLWSPTSYSRLSYLLFCNQGMLKCKWRELKSSLRRTGAVRKNSQMGPHCHIGNSARDQSQKEFRRGALTAKQTMENCFGIFRLFQSSFLVCHQQLFFQNCHSGTPIREWKHFLFVSLSYKVTRSRFLCFFIGDPNICTFLFQATRVNTC